MPITPPKQKSNAQDEKSDDVKVVTEEEYRERMRDEIRREVEQEMRAMPKGADNGGGRQESREANRCWEKPSSLSLRFNLKCYMANTSSRERVEEHHQPHYNLSELVQHIPTWELRQLLDNESRKRRSKRNPEVFGLFDAPAPLRKSMTPSTRLFQKVIRLSAVKRSTARLPSVAPCYATIPFWTDGRSHLTSSLIPSMMILCLETVSWLTTSST